VDKNLPGLQTILNEITLNDYEVIFRGRGNIDFSDEENYKNYVGDFLNIEFPNPNDEQLDVFGTKIYGMNLSTELSCTYAKALRDVEADLRSYRDNPLLSLLRGKEKSIEILKVEGIRTQIDNLNSELSNLDEVRLVSTGIGDSIRSAVGETYAPSISIKSELPSDIDKLMQSLKLWVGDPNDEGYQGRIWELSLGGANIIYLSLKLLEFEFVKSHNKIANFILIEEPEAHIHTHIQKSLFDKLNYRSTQVFITTHSTHISSVCKISSVNVLSISKQSARVFSPSNGLKPEMVTKIERYLDAVRTNLLFAKGVILVEGDAEQILIPELFKNVFGISLDEIGISLINIGSTGFENIATLFHEDRIGKFCSIITDLDTSILELPENKDEDDTELRHCRNSQADGASRKVRLEEFAEEHLVNIYFANYTFEVDFLLAGNSVEVLDAIEKVYKRKADKDAIKKELENEDVSISGKEMLRLAEKFGKGWFAIMLSEHLTHLTFIPTYVIDAIGFAAPHIKRTAIVESAKYRLSKMQLKPYIDDKTDYAKALAELNAFDRIEDAIKFYAGTFPDDQLTYFINKL